MVNIKETILKFLSFSEEQAKKFFQYLGFLLKGNGFIAHDWE